ncbi:MAG: hypothetical protein WCT44_02025 [Candidatus Paceibacterota bacterium]
MNPIDVLILVLVALALVAFAGAGLLRLRIAEDKEPQQPFVFLRRRVLQVGWGATALAVALPFLITFWPS